MPDPRNETPPPEGPDTHAASLEDLVAALGKPSGRDDETADDEHEEALEGLGEPESEGESDEVDPYAEYADLDLATSLPIDPDDDLSKLKGEASPRLMSIVESLLFAASKPMTVKDIRRLLKEPTKRQIQLALKQLILDTQHRGVVLGQVAGGFRLRTHPDNAAFVQKMLAGRPVRLSRSQLESLAVVAYRQPVTKAELDHIRGVDCGAVLRVLLERDLVKIVGRKEEAGRPHLYGTTIAFLEFFNLKALRDLPDLHEFRELNEESEATLKHSMTGSLAEEQEAMGQGKLDFDPEAEGNASDPASGEASADPEAAETAAPEAGADEAGADEAGADEAGADEATPDLEASSEAAPDDEASGEVTSSEAVVDDPTADPEAKAASPSEETPATDESATDESATDEPATDESATDEPATDESASDESATDESATDESASDEPASDEPASDEPATEESASDEPATDESAPDDAGKADPSEGVPSEESPPADVSADDAPTQDAVRERAADEDAPAADAPSDEPAGADAGLVGEPMMAEALDASEPAGADLDVQHADSDDEEHRARAADDSVDTSTPQDGEHAEPDTGDDS